MTGRRVVVGLSVALILWIGSTADVAGQTRDQTVYVTKTGSKYHKAGCSSLSKSAIPMTLVEAAKRYGPCSRCRPPTPTAPAGQAQQKLTPRSTAPAGDGRCEATTKKGTRCSRRAKPGSRYCWQHGG